MLISSSEYVSILLFMLFASTVENTKDVIVVGAGIAGAAAARILHNSDKFRVTVLEARPDRLGGRIYTDRSAKQAQGPESELGSLFLSTPAPGNIFHEILHKLELTTSTVQTIDFVTETGLVRFHSDDIYATLKTQIIEKLKERISGGDRSDFSFADVFSQDSTFVINNHTLLWSTILNCLIEPLFGVNAKNLSGTAFPTGRLSTKLQVLEGLDELVNRLIGGIHAESPIDVELGKVVRQIKIDYDSRKVKVRTVDRRSYTADAVVIALPLGVLKSGNVHFDPKLPIKMRQAIENTGLGLTNAVIVEFSQLFWSEDTHIFILSTHISSSTYFKYWINCYPTTNKAVLISHVIEKYAEEIEKMTDDTLEELVLDSLRKLFSSVRVSQASIVSLSRSRWKKDKYSIGGTSYVSIGTSLSERRIVSQHISPYLYFAGEYTSLDQWGTVEGAYISGVDAAETLMLDLEQKDSKASHKQQMKKEEL